MLSSIEILDQAQSINGSTLSALPPDPFPQPTLPFIISPSMALSAALQEPLPATRLPDELDQILRATSRSIYLTLQVLPRPIRRQLMLGYLFCRAADTIADTRALPQSRRIEMLALYRQQFV